MLELEWRWWIFRSFRSIAASAGATGRLSTPEKADISQKRIRFLWFGLRETQSYNIDESVWYNYVYNIYAKR